MFASTGCRRRQSVDATREAAVATVYVELLVLELRGTDVAGARAAVLERLSALAAALPPAIERPVLGPPTWSSFEPQTRASGQA